METVPKIGVCFSLFKTICFRFRKISKTSSRTFGIVENSCATPGILIPVIAVPSKFESKTLRKAFPIVSPCPASNDCSKKCPVSLPDSSTLDLKY